jgi:hypothetical protein
VGASIASPIAGYGMEDGVPMLKAGASGTAPAAKSPRDSSTSASTGRDRWDFMSDPKGVSSEDKLFHFMTLIQERNDAELTKKMNEFRDKYTKEGSAKKDGGGGIFAFIGNALGSLAGAFPPLALAEKLLGAGGVQKLVAEIPGPLLAGLCTAIGAPALAPLALKAGAAPGEEIGKASSSAPEGRQAGKGEGAQGRRNARREAGDA